MKAAWVVVANPARARLFERRQGEMRLQPLAYFSRAQGNHRAPQAGHAATGADTGNLVTEVSRFLNHGVARDQCGGLVMLAPEDVLGALLAQLTPASLKSIRFEAPVDFTVLTTRELEDRLADFEAANRGERQ